MRPALTLSVVILLLLVSAGCLSEKSVNTGGFSNEAMELNSKGFDLYMNGHYEEALASFNQSIAVAPSFSKAWFNQGMALMKLNRSREAVHSFEKVIELDPSYPSAKEMLDEARATSQG